MYIIKNALKSISRSKGRNILIGIIVLVISVSACIGLSIRQASENAKDEALENLTITGTLSIDRSSMMNDMRQENSDSGTFDKDSFKQNFASLKSLTVDEMLTYAELDSVQSFYYTLTVSLNGDDNLEAVTSTVSSDSTSDDSSANVPSDMPQMNEDMGGGHGGFQKGSMGTQGDFTVVGYSSDEAMADFLNGTSSITDGEMFEEGTSEYNCVISDELAAYNDISVSDTITVENPNNEDETYELTVVGIYNNSQSTVSNTGIMGGFSTSTDPANQIYLSYNALKSITDSSSENATTSVDDTTGVETTTALPKQPAGTYTFASIDDYNKFSKDVYTAGLSETYTVSSSDVSAYEDSLVPLENLSDMAFYFLLVVLGIGAVVLIVLNIFNVRERKYEVGVLTAIGMKKFKVSLQFIIETLVITFVSVLLGGIIGAASSVPVTNSLLKSQVEAEESSSTKQEQSLGRGGNSDIPDMPSNNSKPGFSSDITATTNEYISKVSSATDLTVLLQLLGIGICLTLVASAASVVFIMRYDPLKILANRD